jgi:hypothetical protein
MRLTLPLVLLLADVILLYEVTERVRRRLRMHHANLFHALGKPTLEESNLQYSYRIFVRFLWWDHRKVSDPALRRLCIVYCLGAIAAMVLIVILWSNRTH